MLMFVALDVFFDVNTIITLILSSTLATKTTNPNCKRDPSTMDSLIKNSFNFHSQVQFLETFQFAVPSFFRDFLEGNSKAFFADLIGPKNQHVDENRDPV